MATCLVRPTGLDSCRAGGQGRSTRVAHATRAIGGRSAPPLAAANSAAAPAPGFRLSLDPTAAIQQRASGAARHPDIPRPLRAATPWPGPVEASTQSVVCRCPARPSHQ